MCILRMFNGISILIVAFVALAAGRCLAADYQPQFPDIFHDNAARVVSITSETVDTQLGYQTTEEYADFNIGKQAYVVRKYGKNVGILVDGPANYLYQYEPYKCDVKQIVGGDNNFLGPMLYDHRTSVALRSSDGNTTTTAPIVVHGVMGMWLYAATLPSSYSEGQMYSFSTDTYGKVHIWQFNDGANGVLMSFSFVMSFGAKGPTPVLESIRVTSAETGKLVKSVRVFAVENYLADEVYENLFQIPVGFGCTRGHGSDNALDAETKSLLKGHKFPSLAQNYKLELEATASKFVTQPSGEKVKSSQTQVVELAAANSQRPDESIQLIRRRDMISDIKTIVNHETNVLYKIDMSLNGCKIRSLGDRGAKPEVYRVKFWKVDIAITLDLEATRQLFDSYDGFQFVRRTRAHANPEVEHLHFEKTLETTDFGKPSRIIRVYSIFGRSQLKLESVSVWVFENAEQLSQVFHLDIVRAERLESWPSIPKTFDISDECYLANERMKQNRDFAWFKLSYSLPTNDLSLLAKHSLQVRNQLHFDVFRTLGGFFRVPRVELDFAESSMSLRVLMLDNPPIHLTYRLAERLRLTEQSNSRRRSLMLEISVDLDHCSELCRLHQCRAMSFCANLHECILSMKTPDTTNGTVGTSEDQSCETYIASSGDVNRFQRSGLSYVISELQHQDFRSLNLPKSPDELSYAPQDTKISESEYRVIVNNHLANVHDYLRMKSFRYPQLLLKIRTTDRFIVQMPDAFELENDPLDQFDAARRDNLESLTYSGESVAATFHHGLGTHRYKMSALAADESLASNSHLLAGLTYDQCALSCLDGRCSSFSYCKTRQECILTNINSTEYATRSRLLELDPDCVIGQRDFLTNFQQIVDVRQPTSFAKKVVATGASECALLCMLEVDSACLAFSYCEAADSAEPQGCYLQHTRDFTKLDPASDELEAEVKTRCTHFSRSHAADFIRLEHREVKYEYLRRARVTHRDGLSVYRCAEMCKLELEDCSAFQFCLYPASAESDLGPMQTCALIEGKLGVGSQDQVLVDASAGAEVLNGGRLLSANPNCHVFALRPASVETQARELAISTRVVGCKSGGETPDSSCTGSVGYELLLFVSVLVAAATMTFSCLVAVDIYNEQARRRV